MKNYTIKRNIFCASKSKIAQKIQPVRIIINGWNHLTEKIADIVENELSENVRNLTTYIKDTTDF